MSQGQTGPKQNESQAQAYLIRHQARHHFTLEVNQTLCLQQTGAISMPLKISKSHGSRFKLPPQPKPAKTDCWESVTYKSSGLPAPCFCSSSTNPHALAKCSVLHRRITVVGFMCLLKPAYMNPTLWGGGIPKNSKLLKVHGRVHAHMRSFKPDCVTFKPSSITHQPTKAFHIQTQCPMLTYEVENQFFSSVSPVFNQFSLVFTSFPQFSTSYTTSSRMFHQFFTSFSMFFTRSTPPLSPVTPVASPQLPFAVHGREARWVTGMPSDVIDLETRHPLGNGSTNQNGKIWEMWIICAWFIVVINDNKWLMVVISGNNWKFHWFIVYLQWLNVDNNWVITPVVYNGGIATNHHEVFITRFIKFRKVQNLTL